MDFRWAKGSWRSSSKLDYADYSDDLAQREAMYLENGLTINAFDMGKTVGTGSFGRVRFATRKETGNFYALKILKKSAIIKMKQVEHVIQEKNILKILRHPFTVNLFGLFSCDRYLYLALEYVCGGEFFSHLRKKGRFSNHIARFFAAQITSIFECCHSEDIIYRDLKPENILLARDGYLKLADFGFAKIVPHRTYTLCGTPEYIAPEILMNKGHGKPVDWWTLGILIYEMVCGYPPFQAENPMGIYQKVLGGYITFPHYFYRQCKNLVKNLLNGDYRMRYGCMKNGARDVTRCSWFKSINWARLLEKRYLSPYKPEVKSAWDTSNFEMYPDSTELPPAIGLARDPFRDWSMDEESPLTKEEKGGGDSGHVVMTANLPPSAHRGVSHYDFTVSAGPISDNRRDTGKTPTTVLPLTGKESSTTSSSYRQPTDEMNIMKTQPTTYFYDHHDAYFDETRILGRSASVPNRMQGRQLQQVGGA